MKSDLVSTAEVDKEIDYALNVPVHPDRIALVSEHPDFPGCLYFDVGDWDNRQDFYQKYPKWVSRHLILNELFHLDAFVDQLKTDHWYVIFDESTAEILKDYHRWSTPLEIDGYELHDYQNFSLQKALERYAFGAGNDERFFFWNWSAGAGKSYCCGAGIKAIQDTLDLVIACTTSDLKINLYRFLHDKGIDVAITDGDKAKRQKIYDAGHKCLVMNFEKLRVDFDQLLALTKGKRVLYILDEAQKVIADSGQNQSRAALDKLVNASVATVWPLTATAVGKSPLRYRDVFALDGHPRKNVLGPKKDFEQYYAKTIEDKVSRSRSGVPFPIRSYTWDTARLQEIRHRVADRVMAVRRTSKMATIPTLVQPSDGQLEAFSVITEIARRDVIGKGIDPGPYMRLLRMVAITPEALAHTEDLIAAEVNEKHPHLQHASAPKVAMLNEMLENIADQGDQAVCFVHWTTAGLHPISRHLTVKHVKHWGTGQSRTQSQKAVDDFKSTPSITAFMSSDAGALGLSFQNARYVINIDPTYDYDLLTQRNKRIDRADSYLDGLTSYVLITEGSIEERLWRVCQARMAVSAATQGTDERLSPEDHELAAMSDIAIENWSLFG
jgi:hypothetical protein